MSRDHANAATVFEPLAEIAPTAARDHLILFLLGEDERKAQTHSLLHERRGAPTSVQKINNLKHSQYTKTPAVNFHPFQFFTNSVNSLNEKKTHLFHRQE